jgi:hypothetical protein
MNERVDPMDEGNDGVVSTSTDKEVFEVRKDETVPTAPVAEEKPAKSYDESYVKELREEAAKHRTEKQAEKSRVDKLEKELKAFRDAQLSDDERAKQELEDLRKSSTDNLTRAQDAELKFQLAVNAGKEGIQDIKAAIKLVDRDDLTFDDKGNITNLKDTLAALKDEHPWLVGKPAAPSVGTTNPARTPAEQKYTKADLKGMAPEEISKLYHAGKIKF